MSCYMILIAGEVKLPELEAEVPPVEVEPETNEGIGEWLHGCTSGYLTPPLERVVACI